MRTSITVAALLGSTFLLVAAAPLPQAKTNVVTLAIFSQVLTDNPDLMGDFYNHPHVKFLASTYQGGNMNDHFGRMMLDPSVQEVVKSLQAKAASLVTISPSLGLNPSPVLQRRGLFGEILDNIADGILATNGGKVYGEPWVDFGPGPYDLDRVIPKTCPHDNVGFSTCFASSMMEQLFGCCNAPQIDSYDDYMPPGTTTWLSRFIPLAGPRADGSKQEWEPRFGPKPILPPEPVRETKTMFVPGGETKNFFDTPRPPHDDEDTLASFTHHESEEEGRYSVTTYQPEDGEAYSITAPESDYQIWKESSDPDVEGWSSYYSEPDMPPDVPQTPQTPPGAPADFGTVANMFTTQVSQGGETFSLRTFTSEGGGTYSERVD
ncbi:hypothetical protein AUEXF2481DRAFT_9117 [Aureobasidium subglaciale EXF-2481]|uniref:Uncharacterized protein n=1 Tax=Aureobasidium subglaciale (strain EXF-2481) TaxID=1043005 RepID=A0A074XZ69_AURSE|nr:uncharacterized protein AUEXF2481DRAFT_9117 [Aureobasidium subglaciale EXF-2481]KAI5198105.1 hypothetical protein E4T38_07668 [Aureobasidium subglaciale]KAI5216865.1 hypothetical protein E4T40_07678 [Aureobasidium subglaciale]KAI5220208.1 hypothetical protein E4T41_07593 [Aureobasidium subglaciale]KAI5258184.1 hypothetical protein E4T46_07569 [Aureobasidium subglaciale]KEQ90843.1 hypothetical protein AUEXF2481DRAFT_9117 [Aureobasidium subglaciale EXF-2481]